MLDKWWENKSLSEMSDEEWESLCDHCGKCCLIKLEDEESGDVYYTDVACYLVNPENCHCGDYKNRQVLVPDCVKLTPENLAAIAWMPLSCSYRRVMEGRGLPDWHHLVSGDVNSVHERGMSIKGRYVDEKVVDDVEDHVVEWPLLEGNE